jgi:uncharacterized protein YbjT (DUF2867 family)
MIAVTGCTGAVGGRVARLLADHDARQRLVLRDVARAPQVAADHEIAETPGYHDPEAMRRAFEGADTVFLVSARESADRLEQHFTAVDAAVAAGVGRLVYLSFLGASPNATFTLARQHWATEEHIRASRLRHTFLRASNYLDFVPFLAGDGSIRGPAGGGRVASVSRDDLAEAAVAVLLGDSHDGETYDITGPEAFTMAEAAQALSDVTGADIEYVEETIDEAYESRAHYGAPDFEVEGWVTSYLAIAAGEMDVVSGAVEHLTGHPPEGLRAWLNRNPDAWEHLG